MVPWVPRFCFIVAVIKLCTCDLPDGTECPYEALVASNFTGTKNETTVDVFSNEDSSTCGCEARYCLPLCCPMGSFLVSDYNECQPTDTTWTPEFPAHHDPRTLKSLPGELPVTDYHVFVRDPCDEPMTGDPYEVDPETNPFILLSNGSIVLLPNAYGSDEEMVHFTVFCFAAVADKPVYQIRLCEDNSSVLADLEDDVPRAHVQFGLIISIPCLFVTFVVYVFVPELKKTMHGATIRPYLVMLMTAYVGLVSAQMVNPETMDRYVCIALGFVIHFSFLASFFWLNVMCFDIWWTFGGFRSLQGSVKQRERKKFIIYSAYAWGCPLFMTAICLIMDFVPSVPRSWIRPEFGVFGCWIHSDAALGIYFYGPMGLTVICNIFLFISTAMKIVQHKKDTAHHLKGMDSRRHDDHKQWFNLYLKLFIVMGINWSMEIISWIFKKNSPNAVWIITDLANALQGLIIFIIFVWKDKIKRLLLKRLGFRDRNFKSGNSSRSAYHSSTSRTTCTAATVLAPLQDRNKYASERARNFTDESDCV